MFKLSICFIIILLHSCNFMQTGKDDNNISKEAITLNEHNNHSEVNSHEEIICDTIMTDNYPWTFFISASNELFFNKGENRIFKYVGHKFENYGNINNDLYFHTFYIQDDFFIGEFGDVIDFDVYIYDLKKNKLIVKIPNNLLVGVNKGNLYTKDTEEYNYGKFLKRALRDNIEIGEFEGDANFILCNNSLITYDAVFSKKKNKAELRIKVIDTEGKIVREKVIMHTKQKLLFIFNNYYFAIEDNVLLLIDNNTGRILYQWKLIVNKFFQAVVINNELLLYDWLNEEKVEEGYDEFFFVCQKIKLPDILDIKSDFRIW
jgi:hypothetical protein